MHTYEAMVLIDSGQENFEAACEPIRRLLDRNEAEVLAMKLWDERRLAYEIKGRRRGTYVLVYFKMNAANVAELENDFKLEDKVLRVLILRNEDVTDELLKADTPATAPPREDDGDRRGGSRRRDDRRDRDSKSEKPAASDDKSEKKGDKAGDEAGDSDGKSDEESGSGGASDEAGETGSDDADKADSRQKAEDSEENSEESEETDSDSGVRDKSEG